MPYKILVVTTSRADFGIYRPVLAEMAARPELEPSLLVTGMHLSSEFGQTIDEVKSSPWKIAASFECLLQDDSPEGISGSMALAMTGSASALAELKPDMVMVLGDRFEMAGSTLAAVPALLPVVHLHGGEETEGATDNVFRHMITKLSHLHCCATPMSKKRLLQMGEDPERVIQTGAPALDSVSKVELLDRHALEKTFGISADEPFALVTYHPMTMDLAQSGAEFDAMCNALEQLQCQLVFTAANADSGGRMINKKINDFAEKHSNVIVHQHMGLQGYFSAMNEASFMIGNSSSGILEAASFNLPVINIGDRQAGREQSGNIINATFDAENISDAVEQVSSEAFRKHCQTVKNIYGDGGAAPRIADAVVDFLAKGNGARKAFNLL